MLPLVGAIAAVNAEAAVAIAELGEGLKSKVEQSSYMPISLKDLFGEEKAEAIKKIIESNLRQKQQAKLKLKTHYFSLLLTTTSRS